MGHVGKMGQSFQAECKKVLSMTADPGKASVFLLFSLLLFENVRRLQDDASVIHSNMAR